MGPTRSLWLWLALVLGWLALPSEVHGQTAAEIESGSSGSGAAALSSPIGASPVASPSVAPAVGHDSAEFALDVTAFTTLPLAVGGAVALEVPGHLVLRVSAGAIPNAYIDAINDVGTGWGAWDQNAASVASTLLVGATYLEFAVGLRPAGTPGIELSIGYAMLWSHRTAGMNLVGAPGDRTLGLDLSIDAVHAELAWQTELIDHVYFRLALGWAHAVAQHLTLRTDATDDATRAALAQGQAALAQTVAQHSFGPTLGAALGARF